MVKFSRYRRAEEKPWPVYFAGVRHEMNRQLLTWRNERLKGRTYPGALPRTTYRGSTRWRAEAWLP